MLLKFWEFVVVVFKTPFTYEDNVVPVLDSNMMPFVVSYILSTTIQL